MSVIQIELLLSGLRDLAGNPLAGGLVYTYAAGTTSAQACWLDSLKQNQAANPIVLSAAGMAQVYAEGSYKLDIHDALDTPLYSWDNLVYQTIQSSSWTVVPVAITYVSATQFKATGDYTASFPANIAIQVTIATGPITGWVTSSDYNVTNSGKTTVNVLWQSTTMTSAVNGTEASIGPNPATLPPPEASGIIKPFAGATAPAGYLICDGTAYLKTLYPGLYAVIGVTWGGDSTTFNVPDFRGRGLIGVGSGIGLTTRVLAAYGGSETHTLSAGEMPVHNHVVDISDPTHAHVITTYGSTGSTGYPNGLAGSASTNPYDTTAVATGVTASSQNAGSGGAHAIMNPFVAVNFIIKF